MRQSDTRQSDSRLSPALVLAFLPVRPLIGNQSAPCPHCRGQGCGGCDWFGTGLGSGLPGISSGRPGAPAAIRRQGGAGFRARLAVRAPRSEVLCSARFFGPTDTGPDGAWDRAMFGHDAGRCGGGAGSDRTQTGDAGGGDPATPPGHAAGAGTGAAVRKESLHIAPANLGNVASGGTDAAGTRATAPVAATRDVGAVR